MSLDPSNGLMTQVKEQFEELDRTTRSSLDRLRAVIHRNKKELEGPIFQNKNRLEKMGKTSKWLWILLVAQTVALTWLLFVHLETKRQVDLLVSAATDLEVETIKSLQKMESEVIHLQKEQDNRRR